MRHLFVTNDFPPKQGGIESYLLTLASGFDPGDVVVVAPARKGWEEVDAPLPYAVVRLPGNYLHGRRSVGEKIARAAVEHEADVIHFLQTLPLGRLGRLVGKRAGRPVTVVAHGNEVIVPSKTPFVRQVTRRVLVSADLVFAVSEYTAEAVRRFTKGRARIGLLPPAVDVRRFSLGVSGARVREHYGLGSEFVVLFVGRLVKRKGAEILIRALGGMPRGVALVVGTGPEEAALRKVVAELGLQDRVVMAGQVDDETLPEYYAAADAFCMPVTGRFGGLDTEGFGIVYLEAAASGLASVAGAAGGSIEAVVHGETGLVIEEPNPGLVAEALRRLERDETLRTALGANGRLRAETEFAPEVMARRLEEQLGVKAPAS